MQLYGVRPLAISAGSMQREARKQALLYSEEECRAEAEFLAGQGLASRASNPVSGQLVYSITSAGIMAYEQEQG